MTIFDDNFWWQFLMPILMTILMTIFDDKFWWQFLDDNFFWDLFSTCDLWYLRHWLQYWQLRTWFHDNLCYLTINCDIGQHSQFLRCFIYWNMIAFCKAKLCENTGPWMADGHVNLKMELYVAVRGNICTICQTYGDIKYEIWMSEKISNQIYGDIKEYECAEKCRICWKKTLHPWLIHCTSQTKDIEGCEKRQR